MKGHLRRRGGSWELRAFAGRDPVTGREIYRTTTFRGGKREAEDALARFVQEVAGGHSARDATVGDLVAAWFELAKQDLSPSTIVGSEACIKRYVSPTLGEVPLDRLKVAQLDHLYAELRTRGGVASTAGFASIQPHLTPCWSARRRIAWTWRTVAVASGRLACPPPRRSSV